MTPEAAAKKIGVKPPKLADWEAGRARPTVVQLRKAAHVYRRPLAVFFLPTPPPEPEPLHDFRRLRPDETASLSPALRLEMRRARRRRAVALELLADQGVATAATLPRSALDHEPDRVAGVGRDWLGVSLETQVRWRGDYEGLAGWTAAFEARDVLVFHAGDVSLEEMRGFSLSEAELPVVVLNAKDTPRGRVFTLMHEFVHLMLNRGGVCDPLRADRRPRTPDDEVEVFCNRVAGALLVPAEPLLQHPAVAAVRRPQTWPEDILRGLAEDFAVSREVILRRLLILNRTTEDFYERKRREYLEQYRGAAARRRQAEGYAPLYRLVVRDNGRRYTRLILRAFTQERITGADLADYLGVRLKHVGDIADAVQERAAEA